MLPFTIILNREKKIIQGQSQFTGTAVNTTFTVPSGVSDISTLCVGCGKRGGGGLSWRNHISVTAGEVLTVQINTTSTKISRADGTVLCIANAGTNSDGGTGGKSANSINDGGGNGGAAYTYFENDFVWLGGGAAGYTGNGGTATSKSGTGAPAGGGGGSGAAITAGATNYYQPGGVGILGQGASGATYSAPGSGGSGRTYGGGCTWSTDNNSSGAIRILWGVSREYPSTNTGDKS